MNLSMTASSTGSQTVVEIAGEVDLHTAGRLADRLTALLESGPRTLVVDLSSLSFLDSTGLGALVTVRNHARRSGADLRLVCVPERLLKLFRITGLHTAFEIYPTLTQALAGGGSAANVPIGQG
ncbi:MAG: STAS domain-containing protein [Actinobacteria bacterium]|nr:STAS domain-containing protein [Actinomycetota bacterium]